MTTETIQSKTIQVNGVPVTCHSDGSITCYNKASGRPVRSFGNKQHNGYMYRWVSERMYRAHRLICSAFHGRPPKGYDVDHVNGIKDDNRPENLRWASRSENLRGARRTHGESKYRGVSRNGPSWSATVLRNYCGSFGTQIEAAQRWDDVAFHEHDFPLEGLNFPQRMLDKMAKNDTPMSMTISSEKVSPVSNPGRVGFVFLPI
jgi:hypothetical protein